MSDIIREIADERSRQMDQEGWSMDHDDKHTEGEMADAAACYAMTETTRQLPINSTTIRAWIWPSEWTGWWKPKDRRRDLIRAAALIVAEIERMDRKEGRK